MLSELLIYWSVMVGVCLLLNKFSIKIGTPALLLFIVFGLIAGAGYEVSLEESRSVENISTIALVIIMFSGGFGTMWKTARPVVVEAGILATVGVAATAVLVGVFCHYALHWGWVEGLLIGATISSTDAASVFSILRGKKLGLKNGLAPLLEVESGSNDPCSFMFTSVMITLLTSNISAGNVAWMIAKQFIFGAGAGLLLAQAVLWVQKRFSLSSSADSALFYLTLAMTGYAVPNLIGGNGFLSVYIIGIVIGNSAIRNKKETVAFFDAVTGLMQMILFFILGYMVSIKNVGPALIPAALIFLFVTLVARPAAVFSILLPMRGKNGGRKYKANEMGFISFVGLRGAASIVFALMTITGDNSVLGHDIFSIVFVLVLMSICAQGSLIPFAAKKMGVIDEKMDVMTTFSDFQSKEEVSLGIIRISQGSPWDGKMLKELNLPEDVLFPMIIRKDNHFIPNGNTVLENGDEVVVCSRYFDKSETMSVIERPLSARSSYIGKRISDFPNHKGYLVVLIKRGEQRIIPHGDTVLQKGDVLVIFEE